MCLCFTEPWHTASYNQSITIISVTIYDVVQWLCVSYWWCRLLCLCVCVTEHPCVNVCVLRKSWRTLSPCEQTHMGSGSISSESGARGVGSSQQQQSRDPNLSNPASRRMGLCLWIQIHENLISCFNVKNLSMQLSIVQLVCDSKPQRSWPWGD